MKIHVENIRGYVCPFVLAFVFLTAVISPPRAKPQELQELQFIDQPITDILLAVAEISGKSIIPDETVRGNASFHFAETNLDDALAVFLDTYKLYLRTENGVYYVSRISSDLDEFSGTVSMDAVAVVLDRELPAGEEVVLLGDGILAEDHARIAGTIPYEIVCGLNTRAPRGRREVVG